MARMLAIAFFIVLIVVIVFVIYLIGSSTGTTVISK